MKAVRSHSILSAEHEETKSKDVTPAVSLTTLSHLAPVYLLLTQYVLFLAVGERVHMLKGEISFTSGMRSPESTKEKKKKKKALPMPARKHSINLKMRSQNSITKPTLIAIRRAALQYSRCAIHLQCK